MTITNPMTEKQPGPSYQEILDRETRPVPAQLRLSSNVDLGTEGADCERYVSPAFHDLEVERVWKRSWVVACREDSVAAVGDTAVFNLADISILVVRSAPDDIKAFHNVCLHRGAQLRACGGPAAELRCPYHGFAWNLDGKLKDIPSAWDFEHVNRAEFGLLDVQVARWGGFVWINLDQAASPLPEYLGGLVDHMAAIAKPSLEERCTLTHVVKPLAANWKVGLEAFLEALHATWIHPQILMWTGDANSQYDVFPDERHWSRLITPMAVPSPNLEGDIDEQDAADSLIVDLLGAPSLPVPDGATARDAIVSMVRNMLLASGYDASTLTDAQVVDTLGYFVFPNTIIFAQLFASFVFLFRPLDDDPNRSVMEIFFLAPTPAGHPKPAAPVAHVLSLEETISEGAPELGPLGEALDQDVTNTERVQRGLRTMASADSKARLTLGRYQESRIRHFNQLLDEYIGTDR